LLVPARLRLDYTIICTGLATTSIASNDGATRSPRCRDAKRGLTWPVITVFPFIARPDRYIFLKPNVTKKAAHQYEVDFEYASRPNWGTYASLLAFAERIRRDMRSLKPRDMIDLQGFIWVLGSDEYED
jgi:hypothetical protein